jgi:hypothetical protein
MPAAFMSEIIEYTAPDTRELTMALPFALLMENLVPRLLSAPLLARLGTAHSRMGTLTGVPAVPRYQPSLTPKSVVPAAHGTPEESAKTSPTIDLSVIAADAELAQSTVTATSASSVISHRELRWHLLLEILTLASPSYFDAVHEQVLLKVRLGTR